SAFDLLRVSSYDIMETHQCRVIALLHRSLERVQIDVHDNAHDIQSGTRFSIRPHSLFPLLENDFTGPNSICCVDRNVEKKNREQRLKNPVHRAPLSIVRGSQPQTKNQRANRVRPAIRDQRLMESMIQATLVAAKIGLIEDGGQ